MNTDRLSGFNPLRGLTLEGFVHMIEQGERGYYADLMWLYRIVLRRNGTARAVQRKLTAAIGKLDWNIKVPDKLEGERLAAAERQQAVLRAAVDGLRDFRGTLRHLAAADIMGYGHCEKIYALGGEDPWAVTELRAVPQWMFCRDGLFAPWEYNARAEMRNRGVPIAREHWVVREVADAAAEIITFAHLKMSVTDADWDQFCDTYSVPPLFIEMPPNLPRGKEDEYQRTADAVVSDSRGTLPNGAKVHTVSPGGGGESAFVARLRYYREEIVLAGTGGILTTLSGEGAFGQGGASENHAEGWLEIAHEIGMSVSEAIQDQFCAPLLARRFPGEEVLAYFELDKPSVSLDPAEVFAAAKLAGEAGYRIDAAELSEKSGYGLERADGTDGTDRTDLTDRAEDASSAGRADGRNVQAALAEDLDLEARWLAPVADVLGEIEAALGDPAVPLGDVVARIEKAARTMPELLGKLDVDALAHALEAASGPAAVQGLADGLRAKSRGGK